MNSKHPQQPLRALISVSDKRGVLELAQGIVAAGGEIYSTGGTARYLTEGGVPVIDVATYTGFPEMMDGRVKTLHPRIFGGILGRPDHESDRKSMQEQGMVPFQIVCVNLYPFRETVAKPGVALDDAIENIDIGGPSLIRAAAKNHRFVAVLTDALQYPEVLAELQAHGETSLALRQKLMAEAFRHTASYDAAIAGFFGERFLEPKPPQADTLPAELTVQLALQETLRHGENSHQLGGVYRRLGHQGTSVVTARQHNGKQLSYNNFLDMDAALAIVRLQTQPACSVIKHNNPCGAASASELVVACQKAFAGDPVSAFGSVVAFNRPVDVATAQWLGDNRQLFVEVIVAPDFEPEALDLLRTRPKWKTNVRLMSVGELGPSAADWEIRSITGGALVQSLDNQRDDRAQWKVVTDQPVPPLLLEELAFAWDMVRFVKSNAIVVVREHALVGVGAGQMSRVDSTRIALEKAGERGRGSVLASDAFFPFADSIPLAASAGVAAIIQPGGSVNDKDVIAAANASGIPMIFTGRRQFKH